MSAVTCVVDCPGWLAFLLACCALFCRGDGMYFRIPWCRDAVLRLTSRFAGTSWCVPGSVTLAYQTSGLVMQEMPAAQLDRDVSDAFDIAFNNIKAFHEGQQAQPLELETMPGVQCRRITRPIGRHTAYAGFNGLRFYSMHFKYGHSLTIRGSIGSCQNTLRMLAAVESSQQDCLNPSSCKAKIWSGLGVSAQRNKTTFLVSQGLSGDMTCPEIAGCMQVLLAYTCQGAQQFCPPVLSCWQYQQG